MSEMPKVNCPNCGRFCKWNPETRTYSCNCGGMTSYIDGPHIFVVKKADPQVHERLLQPSSFNQGKRS